MVEPKELGDTQKAIQAHIDRENQKETIHSWVERQISEKAECVMGIRDVNPDDVDIQTFLEERGVVDVDVLDESEFGLITFSGIEIPPRLIGTKRENSNTFYLIKRWASISDFADASIEAEGKFDIQKKLKRLKKKLNNELIWTRLDFESNRWYRGENNRPLVTYILHDQEVPRELVMVFPIYFSEESILKQYILKARELRPGEVEELLNKVFK